MEAYTGFAGLYDLFMDDVPYEEWAGYVTAQLRKYGICDGLVLELGCGTGAFTELLAGRGYDMIGVDASPAMLNRAVEKLSGTGFDILYLMQDMRSFELYGTVRAVVSVCDSLNYILDEEEMLQVFRLVNNYLDPGGVFLFDMNTAYKYEQILGDCVIAENREESSFIWENAYDPESGVNEYYLTLYRRTGRDGLYERLEEAHYQRAYPISRVRELLEEAGLLFLGCYEAYTRDEPSPESGRVLFLARESGKQDG